MHPVGSEVSAKISRLNDKGVAVEMPFDLEGFIPTNQLGKEGKKEGKFNVGDSITAMIIELDKEEKKLILSVEAMRRRGEETSVSGYKNQTSSGTTIGDILKAANENK